MPGHDCDKEQVLNLLADGQKGIFKKLDEMNRTLQQVAVQQNEIRHLRIDIEEVKETIKEDREAVELRFTEIEKACEQRHTVPKQTLMERIFHAVAIAIAVSAATAIFWLFVWIGYQSMPDFLQFKKNPVSQSLRRSENFCFMANGKSLFGEWG